MLLFLSKTSCFSIEAYIANRSPSHLQSFWRGAYVYHYVTRKKHTERRSSFSFYGINQLSQLSNTIAGVFFFLRYGCLLALVMLTVETKFSSSLLQFCDAAKAAKKPSLKKERRVLLTWPLKLTLMLSKSRTN